MHGKIAKMLESTKALLAYINEEHVYDKMGDAGCGGVDPYQSEKFYQLIKNAERDCNELEVELRRF